MTSAMDSVQMSDDSRLVAESRNGNRDAFGQIVRRYQGMITGLIYASIGDLHRSEDLAQETFIAAWKSLAGLREPAKLPAWLCQIVRHRILDFGRNDSRQKTHLDHLLKLPRPHTAPPADAEIISAEENELLWRTLANSPAISRDARFVLPAKSIYRRCGGSDGDARSSRATTTVARARNAARNLAQLLERNLSRSAASERFTAAVIAALPVALPIGLKSAALGGIAKGTAAGSGFLAVFSIMLAPIIAMFCAIVGVKTTFRTIETSRERRFMRRFTFSIFVLVFVGTGVLFCIQPLAEYYNLEGKRDDVVCRRVDGLLFNRHRVHICWRKKASANSR